MRFAFLLGAGAAAVLACGVSVGVGACSSSSDNGFGDDASTQPSGDDASSDGSSGDSGQNPGDDSGGDIPDSPGPLPDVDAGPGVFAACEPVQGPACDLALQNCPSGQECGIAQGGPDGGFTTACFPTSSSEHLGKGHGCCPSANQKQCDPGLECIGDPNMPCDGGIPAGRCTPHCCPGDGGGSGDVVCDVSDPEGYAGHCDGNIVDTQSATPLFYACSYDATCKPFHIKSCPAGTICLVKDVTGTAGCSTIYDPDGGPVPGEDQPCTSGNSCQDGLVCLTNQDGGSSCAMLCLTPSSNPPFDAGALDGGPFHGGCSAGKQCVGHVVDQNHQDVYPSWILICE